MAGKREAKQRAGQSGRKEKNRGEAEESARAKEPLEDAGRKSAQETQKKEAHKDLRDQGEAKKSSVTKRRQVRKVATMVKRLKKSPEDGELQTPTGGEVVFPAGDGWDAQQQATVTAYAQSRGMQPREVLQALVNSMEKTLRKEKESNPASQIPHSGVKQKGEAVGKNEKGNPASQIPLPGVKQKGEVVGKSETGPSPGRGGRDQREKKPDAGCVACHRDKRRNVPPKTRWKEEQKEKARKMESAGKENLAVKVPGGAGDIVVTVPEEEEARQASEGTRAETMATPEANEAAVPGKPEETGLPQASGGALGGAQETKGAETPAPVACVAGVPREPASGRGAAQVARPRGRTPPETLEQVNQQYLGSKYKFKEGAPLKEYLQQKVTSFREPCTLTKVLTWLKEIIRDNLLFDERNPSMIVGDAALEAALKRKRVHVNDIRSVVVHQLVLVEAREGPWSQALLLRGMARLENMPVPPRPEGPTAATPVSALGTRAIGYIPIPPGAVVLHSPGSGASQNPSRDIPAGLLRIDNPMPGLQQEIGVVSYTYPAGTPTAQNGGVASTDPATRGGFTGVRLRPMVHRPGVARPPPLSREAAACISQVIVALTLLLANAGSADGFMAYSCEDMRSPVVSYDLTPQAGCWMRPLSRGSLEQKDGRILWMRDKAQFPVIHCKMVETVMRAGCGPGSDTGPWEMIEIEKLVPITPRDCLNAFEAGRVTLLGHMVDLTGNGTGMKTLEERVNCGLQGQGSARGSPEGPGRPHIQLTIRRIAVWKRMATEDAIKKIIIRKAHDILPSHLAGGMDASEGTYVWDHIQRGCSGGEWEELYKGKLGILKGEVITLDQSAGQRAWLKLGEVVTICGKRMRSTHLRRVYVRWTRPQRIREVITTHPTSREEKELEGMRLEWSYQRGRDSYMIRRELREAATGGCWTRGTLAELRQSQAAGTGGARSAAAHFGVGHLAVRSGGVVYIARCRMVVVELRNHTYCTQEIPVMHRGEELYVDPLSLVVQRSATPVKCRKKTPPRWKIGKSWFCGYPEIRPCNGPGPPPEHRCTNIRGGGINMEAESEGDVQDRYPEDGGHHSLSREALERLSLDIGKWWLGGYEGLEVVPGVVGTAMLGVSIIEMTLSTIVRMSALYAWKGPGPWMAAALWSTAFQVVIMPYRWALEWGQNQGDAIARTMENKVGGANLPLDGGGTSTTDKERK